MDGFLSAAKKIVSEAGLMAKKMLSSSHIRDHKQHGDVVTDGDICVENHVISSLEKLFPNHGFDSEEMGQKNADAEYVWILDPIDGTKYYNKDMPLYAVSLALKQRGKETPILGVVYSPEFNRMYSAGIGKGAALNGRPIYCSDVDRLEDASICLEIPSRDSSSAELQWAMEKMSVLVRHAYRVRIIGVGSLGLCFCAMGGFDAYVNLGCLWKPCDHAAGRVIIREAGGEFSYLGKQGRQIVAGPTALCNEIRTILNV